MPAVDRKNQVHNTYNNALHFKESK